MADNPKPAFQATARRGRPQRFVDVIGQEHITSVLQGALERGKVSHAYLFSGPRGVGKTSTARILAKALNCHQGVGREPCNECHACRSITAGNFIDVIEIDAASNRGIDNIRDLREAVRFSPAEGRTKVYIIDEVHMLTAESFNALLKTLEEPPDHAKFVLATTEEHKLPDTILSRCQRFHFRRGTVVQIIESLRRNYADEEKTLSIPDAVFNYVARAARGSIRDSQSLMDQVIALSGEQVSLEDVQSLLGAVSFDHLIGYARLVHEGHVEKALELIDRISSGGRDLGRFLQDLIVLYRNLLVAGYVNSPEQLIDLAPEHLAEAVQLSGRIKPDVLLLSLDALLEAENQLKISVDDRLIVELVTFKLGKIGETVSLHDLIARVEGWSGETDSGNSPATAQKKTPEPVTPPKQTPPATAPPEETEVPGRQELIRDEEPSAAAVEKAGQKGQPPEGAPPAPSAAEKENPAPKSGASSARIEMVDPDAGVSADQWRIFLDDLENSSLRVCSYLEGARPLSLKDNTITIAIPRVHVLQHKELKRKTNQAIIGHCLERVFNKKLNVEWTLEDIEVYSSTDIPPEDHVDMNQLLEEAAKDPHVQQVLDLFDGKLVDRKLKRKGPSVPEKKGEQG